jgi:hypothetical protein
MNIPKKIIYSKADKNITAMHIAVVVLYPFPYPFDMKGIGLISGHPKQDVSYAVTA